MLRPLADALNLCSDWLAAHRHRLQFSQRGGGEPGIYMFPRVLTEDPQIITAMSAMHFSARWAIRNSMSYCLNLSHQPVAIRHVRVEFGKTRASPNQEHMDGAKRVWRDDPRELWTVS